MRRELEPKERLGCLSILIFDLILILIFHATFSILLRGSRQLRVVERRERTLPHFLRTSERPTAHAHSAKFH